MEIGNNSRYEVGILHKLWCFYMMLHLIYYILHLYLSPFPLNYAGITRSDAAFLSLRIYTSYPMAE